MTGQDAVVATPPDDSSERLDMSIAEWLVEQARLDGLISSGRAVFWPAWPCRCSGPSTG